MEKKKIALNQISKNILTFCKKCAILKEKRKVRLAAASIAPKKDTKQLRALEKCRKLKEIQLENKMIYVGNYSHNVDAYKDFFEEDNHNHIKDN